MGVLRMGNQRQLKRRVGKTHQMSLDFIASIPHADRREVTKSVLSSFFGRGGLHPDGEGSRKRCRGNAIAERASAWDPYSVEGGEAHSGALQTAYLILKEKENYLRFQWQPHHRPPPPPRQGNRLPWRLQVASLRIFKMLRVGRQGFKPWKEREGERGREGDREKE